MTTGYFIDIAILIAAHLVVWRLGPAYTRLEKYEFDNTSDGGVVRFDSFKQSRNHQFKKLQLLLPIQAAAAIGCIAFFALMFFGDLGLKTAFVYLALMVSGFLLYLFWPRR